MSNKVLINSIIIFILSAVSLNAKAGFLVGISNESVKIKGDDVVDYGMINSLFLGYQIGLVLVDVTVGAKFGELSATKKDIDYKFSDAGIFADVGFPIFPFTSAIGGIEIMQSNIDTENITNNKFKATNTMAKLGLRAGVLGFNGELAYTILASGEYELENELESNPSSVLKKEGALQLNIFYEF